MDIANINTTTHRDEVAWLAARHAGIGSSDAAAIMGASPYDSAYQVVARKLGLAPEKESTEQMEWGHRLEPVVRQAYQEETGRNVHYRGPHTIVTSRDVPFMLASLDGELYHPEKGWGTLEIKTTSGYHKEEELEEGAPLRMQYELQMQHQMACAGFKWGSLAVLFGGQKLRWLDVDRNNDAIHALQEECTRIWDLVQQKKLPEPDGSENTKKILEALYPTAYEGTTIDLGDEALEWFLAWETAKADIKGAEKNKVFFENKLRAAIGNHETARFPGSVVATLKTTRRKGYQPEYRQPTTYRTLRRA